MWAWHTTLGRLKRGGDLLLSIRFLQLSGAGGVGLVNDLWLLRGGGMKERVPLLCDSLLKIVLLVCAGQREEYGTWVLDINRN